MIEVACLSAAFSVPIAIIIALSSLEDARCEKATTILLAAHTLILLCLNLFTFPHPSGRIAAGLLAAGTAPAFGVTPAFAIFNAARVERFKKLSALVVILTIINVVAWFLSLGSLERLEDAIETAATSYIIHCFNTIFVGAAIAVTVLFSPIVAFSRLDGDVREKTTTSLLAVNALFLLLLPLCGFPIAPRFFGACGFFELLIAPVLSIISLAQIRSFKKNRPLVVFLSILNILLAAALFLQCARFFRVGNFKTSRRLNPARGLVTIEGKTVRL